MTIEEIKDNIKDQIEDLIWERWEGLTPGAIGDILLAWTYLRFIFDTYLCYRQVRVHNLHQAVPKELKAHISADTFEKARIYRRDRVFYKMLNYVYFMLITTVYIKTGALFKIWMTSGPILDYIGIWPADWDREIGQTLIFVTVGTLFFNFAEALPLELISVFVIEEIHGFNKQSFGHYFKGFLMRNIVEIVLGAPSAAIIVKIVQEGGQYFFIWLWIFTCLWVMGLMTIYPTWIAPLFNKYKPLREGRLRTSLTRLASTCGFPLEDIYILKESSTSNHSGAYFIGMWASKRIVLKDNLLISYPDEDNYFGSSEESEDLDSRSTASLTHIADNDKGCSEEEIAAIVAHEIGHWRLNHILLDVIIAQAHLFLFFVVFSYIYQKSVLYEAFGSPRRLKKPIFMGLFIVVNHILDVYNFIINFLIKMLTRHFEYEADEFAVRLGYGARLKSAIIKMNIDNLKYPYFDPFYSSFIHHHPPVLQRLKAIDATMLEMRKKTK